MSSGVMGRARMSQPFTAVFLLTLLPQIMLSSEHLKIFIIYTSS
jgi:hypothetical protein